MNGHNRVSAALLACALVCVLLFSVFFIALEAEHDCAGEDCAVCAVLTLCENLLRQLPCFTAAAAGFLLCHAGVYAVFTRRASPRAFSTPVTLRVKLSD